MGTVTITELTENQQNVNASNFNQLIVPLLNEFNGSISNANIASDAAIAYSKLSLGGAILNSDISSSAAIDDSKLAQITTADKVALSALEASGNYTPTGIWDFSGATFAGASPIVFEGSTDDGFETTVAVTDPTADRTLTIPNYSIDLGAMCVTARSRFNGSTSTDLSSDGLTPSKNSTGNYTYTFDTARSGANTYVAIPIGGTGVNCSVDSQSTGSFTVTCQNASGTAADTVVNVIVVGVL